MAIVGYKFEGFNDINSYVAYFTELNNETYIFTARWSEYCKCAFLDITDYYDNPIITGLALTNGLKIRHNKLPYVFVFRQINGETYEPTIDNLAKEFALFYDDGAEE